MRCATSWTSGTAVRLPSAQKLNVLSWNSVATAVCAERTELSRFESNPSYQPHTPRFLKAWKTTAGRIAAVHGSIPDGPTFCAVSLHCSKSDGTFDLLSCLKCVRSECFRILALP